MKRSQIIELITDRLIMYEEDTIQGPEEHARRLLDALEEAGMLPPPEDLELASDYILHYYPYEKINSDEDYIVGSLWESEDEA